MDERCWREESYGREEDEREREKSERQRWMERCVREQDLQR